MNVKPVYKRFPLVPIERRAGAFLIDFVSVWLLSSFLGGNIWLQGIVFLLLWLGLRVILVSSNQGQTLGRWALDMKILDAQFAKMPSMLALTQREGILGFCSLLAMIGLSINLANAISMLLLISPLAADCGVALTDAEAQQAFHDHVAQTIVIQTRRGFSLDLRLKKWFAEFKSRMR
ncbi:MAG: RDD family protein [Symploca sp. SIO2E6]|nr:RDD family protein [Symploca sp. SIO2E6]